MATTASILAAEAVAEVAAAEAVTGVRLALPAGVTLPEAPLFIAGALGGPFVIGVLAPLRNACTLASQDKVSTARGIFERVFSRGVSRGWTGATAPAAAATIQFTTLGPGYHFYLHQFGSPYAACVAGAITESVITYAPSTRNAQLMHNRVADPAAQVKVSGMRVAGPGFAPLLVRNLLANSGIRVLSNPFASMLARGLPESAQSSGACKVGGDFLASITCGALSMPFNQLYNFQVTSRASLEAAPKERVRLGIDFLKSQYLVTTESGKTTLSRMVLRDASLRAMYIGCLFSSYAAVERAALKFLA